VSAIIVARKSAVGVQLEIPDSVSQAIRLPEQRLHEELLAELAVALYQHGLLSFGKARELADLDKYDFGKLLGQRAVVRHYGEDELKDDITYARGE
jgi:predicted HTH domain antitoxin